MTNKLRTRESDLVVQDLKNEILIYDLKIDKAFCLNQTAAIVWRLCDGKRSAAEISRLMCKEKKTKVSENFVWLALEGLKKENLLENADEITNHFGGLSRREAIKRVGLSSMVMLPLISSIIAPTAALAQSGNTCIVNQCFAAGSSACIACLGRTITYSAYPSTDGSCSGQPVISNFIATCAPRSSTGVDIRLTNVA
jgi:Coenzyme PQQ synthesis protein D (PqqD)